GAQVTRLAWPETGASINVINTDLATLFRERPAQAAAITSDNSAEEAIPVGDFSCTPWSPAYRPLSGRMQSATHLVCTWPARLPMLPIDHIFYRGPIDVVHAGSWTPDSARRASDRLPLIAELAYQGAT